MANERKLTVVLAGDTTKLKNALNSADGSLSKFGSGARKAGLLVAGLGVAGVGAAVAFAGVGIKNFLSAGDAVQKMSLKTGFSTETLSEFRHAAELSGGSLEGFEKSINRMNRVVDDAGDGLAGATDSLDKLGISYSDLQGMSPEQQFDKIAVALAGIEDAGTKSALAQEIFGRSGTDLLPMLSQGADGLAAMRQEARDLGLVFDEDAANGAAEFNDNLDRLKKRFTAFQMDIAQKVVPALNDLVVWLGPKVTEASEMAKEVFEWFKENALPVLEDLADKAAAVGAAIRDKLDGPIRSVLTFLNEHRSVIAAAAVGIGTVLAVAFGLWAVSAGAAAIATIAALAPVLAIGLAIAALGAGVFLVIKHWDDLTAKYPILAEAQEKVTAAFTATVAFVKRELVPAFQQIAAVAKEVVSVTVGWFQQHWGTISAIVQPIIDQVVSRVKLVLTTIRDVTQLIVAIFKGDWAQAWDELKQIVGNFVTYFQETWEQIVAFLGTVVPLLLEGAKKLMGAIWDGLKAIWPDVKAWFEGLPGLMKDAMFAAISKLYYVGKDIIDGLKRGVAWLWDNEVKPFMEGLPGKIVDAFGAAGEILLGVGKAIMSGLWNGMKEKWEEVKGWLSGLGGVIGSLKGPIDEDAKLLVPHGVAIMQGLAKGLDTGWTATVKPLLQSIAGSMAAEVATANRTAQAALESAAASGAARTAREATPTGAASGASADGTVYGQYLGSGYTGTFDQFRNNLIGGPGGPAPRPAVNFNGPITINARDEAEARQAAGDIAFLAMQALRARGVA